MDASVTNSGVRVAFSPMATSWRWEACPLSGAFPLPRPFESESTAAKPVRCLYESMWEDYDTEWGRNIGRGALPSAARWGCGGLCARTTTWSPERRLVRVARRANKAKILTRLQKEKTPLPPFLSWWRFQVSKPSSSLQINQPLSIILTCRPQEPQLQPC